MVQVMVNPGRRVRDKVNRRDAVGGDVIEVRDVDRRVLMHRGYVSDPAPGDSQAASPIAGGTQAQPTPEPQDAEAASDLMPVMTSRDMEPETESDTSPPGRRRAYRRRDMVPE